MASAYENAAQNLAEARAAASEGWAAASSDHGERTSEAVRSPGTATFQAAKVVAEGDSWLDYPRNDISDCLDDHGYDVLRIATRGHLIEDIAHTQLPDLVRAIEKHEPRFLILSGGGNDIAGDELAMLVNHRESRLATAGETLRPAMVDYLFDHAFYDAYVRTIETAIEAAHAAGVEHFDILGHGYDYPYPDGRAAYWIFGPWLKPALERRGYTDEGERRDLVSNLIDRMNDMQARLAAEYDAYHYLDLRRTLPRREDWANELHPSQKQFGYLAQRFSERMQGLLG